MKQKAAILEFGTAHDDIFSSQVRFLKKSGYEVTLVLNKVFKGRLDDYGDFDDSYFMSLEHGGYSNWKEIFKAWKYLRANNIKYIIINTVQGTGARNFCLLPHWGMNLTGIIHNADLLIGKSNTFRFYIKPRLKKFFALNRYIWDNINLGKKFAYDWFYPLLISKNKSLVHKPENEFWVVIPGNVELKRRDYLGLLESLKGQNLHKNIKFILLGKSIQYKETSDKIKSLISDYGLKDNFVIFDNFIDWDIFNEYTSKADLIATLIHPTSECFVNYSKTKISGSYLIAFNNKVPLLCHKYFQDYTDISESGFFYDDDNLYSTLIDLYNNPNLILQKKSEMNQNPNFDFEFQRKKYIDLVEKLI